MKKEKRIRSLKERNGRYGYFFVAPFALGFILIYLSVIADSFIFSFNEVSMGQNGYELSFAAGSRRAHIQCRNEKYAAHRDAPA